MKKIDINNITNKFASLELYVDIFFIKLCERYKKKRNGDDLKLK